jgi:hypothetical protein
MLRLMLRRGSLCQPQHCRFFRICLPCAMPCEVQQCLRHTHRRRFRHWGDILTAQHLKRARHSVEYSKKLILEKGRSCPVVPVLQPLPSRRLSCYTTCRVQEMSAYHRLRQMEKWGSANAHQKNLKMTTVPPNRHSECSTKVQWNRRSAYGHKMR